MDLTEEQKRLALSEFEKNPDLGHITRLVFNDESLKGTHKEGRIIRAFLVSSGKEHETTSTVSRPDSFLSEAQRQLLMSDQVNGTMTPIEIARLVYSGEEVATLSPRHRAVIDFLQEYRPDILNKEDILATGAWKAPSTFKQVIDRVNRWTGNKFKEGEISNKVERHLKRLEEFYLSPRFNSYINNYNTIADRELFEGEFVRATWDKPDLTMDELNMYITVCMNFVRQRNIQKRLDVFNRTLNDESGASELSMRVVDLIKNTSAELDACEKRVDALMQKLNGSRAARIEKQGSSNQSVINLVESFQEEEGRLHGVRLSRLQNKAVKEQAEKFETMSEYKARIMGITKDELL